MTIVVLVSFFLFNTLLQPQKQGPTVNMLWCLKPLVSLSSLKCMPSKRILFSAFILTVFIVSSQRTSHCHPERPSSFICLVPSQPHSVALAASFLSLTLPRLRPCCFVFTNKSPSCNFCLYIQTHRNNNTVVFMTLRERRASKQHLRRRKWIWWFGVSPQCTLIGWRKITSNCWMCCAIDHGMPDIMVTSEADAFLWAHLNVRRSW